MNVFVLLKMVPDTVEDLEIGADGKSLDAETLRYRTSDPDEHAVEQAILLKERHGGTVTVAALGSPEVEDALFLALAKGADRAVKIQWEAPSGGSRGAAQAFAAYLRKAAPSLPADSLVLVRSQAFDDLDGEIGPLLAESLGMPYLGVVTGVLPEGGQVRVVREFSGGLRGEFRVSMPAVLGIQSADKPPRYVPFAKVKAVQKSAAIAVEECAATHPDAGLVVSALRKPEATGRAQLFEGAPEEIAEQLVEVLQKNNLL